jgi:hypothetical protein
LLLVAFLLRSHARTTVGAAPRVGLGRRRYIVARLATLPYRAAWYLEHNCNVAAISDGLSFSSSTPHRGTASARRAQTVRIPKHFNKGAISTTPVRAAIPEAEPSRQMMAPAAVLLLALALALPLAHGGCGPATMKFLRDSSAEI